MSPEPSPPAAGAESHWPPLPADVLDGARKGEPWAVERFFEHYFDRVYGLVHWLVGERAVAEDITQDIFVKLHRHLHQLDPARDPAPWLHTIAHNACRDVWRRDKRRGVARTLPIDEPEVAETIPAREAGPEESHALEQRAAAVRAAIERLPEALRTLVVLHQYEGLDHRAIAEVTGVSYDAVRKRYSRALQQLGALLMEPM